MAYQVQLFRSPAVFNVAEEPIKFRSGKALELILLLILRGSLSRATAARELWPGLEPERQLANLRLNLTYANQAAPGLLRINRDLIELVAFDAGFESGSPGEFLAGVETEWARAARHDFEETWFSQNLGKAKAVGDLRLAQQLKRQDPLRQEPRVLLASLWMAESEPAKAAAELEEYAAKVRIELGIEVGEDVYLKVGLPSPRRAKNPVQLFGAVSVEDKVASVLGSCPLWLIGGRTLYARARIEDVLRCKGLDRRSTAELWRWKARFAAESGDLDLALAATQEFSRLALPKQKIWAELCEFRIKVLRYDSDQADELQRKLELKKLNQSQSLEFNLVCGVAAYNRTEMEAGCTFAERAAKVAQELGSQGSYARAKGLVGSCHFKLGNIDEAIAAFSESIEICSRFGLSILLSHYHGARGRCHESRGDFVQAECDYNQGINIVGSTEASSTFAILATYLGELLVKKGEIPRGIDWLKKGEGARRQTGERLGRSTSYRCLAKAFLAQGDLRSAADQCSRALAISGNSEWVVEDALNRVVLAQIEAQARRVPQAVINLRTALPVLEREREKGFSHLAEDRLFDPDHVAQQIRELEAVKS